MLEVGIWTLTILLMIIGVAGVIVPLLPGTTLILIAVIIHKLVLPGDLSWLAIGFIRYPSTSTRALVEAQ